MNRKELKKLAESARYSFRMYVVGEMSGNEMKMLVNRQDAAVKLTQLCDELEFDKELEDEG